MGIVSRLNTGAARRAAAVALASASLVASAAVGSIFLTTAREAWTAVAASGPAGPADAILLMTGLGGAMLSIWLGLGLTLSALSALPGALGDLCRTLADRVAPAAVRKIVALILGTTLSAALVPVMPLIENPQCCSSKVPTLVVLQVSGCCWL